MKQPSNMQEVRAGLGLVGLYRKFIPGFEKASETLYQLLEKEKNFFLDRRERTCIARVETETCIGAHPGQPEQPRRVHLNYRSSLTGISAILTQKQIGVNRVNAYASKTLTESNWHYSATKRELCAVVHFTNHFRTYLLCRKIVIVTTHRAVVWLYSFRDAEGIIARWFEKIVQISFEKRHNAGKHIPRKECPSRIQTPESGVTTFETNATRNDTGTEKDTANPWQVLQDTNRKSIELKQNHDKNSTKVFAWLEKKQRPNTWQTTVTSKLEGSLETLGWLYISKETWWTLLRDEKEMKNWSSNAAPYCCWDPSFTYSTFAPWISMYVTYWHREHISQGPGAFRLVWHELWCVGPGWWLRWVPEKDKTAAKT